MKTIEAIKAVMTDTNFRLTPKYEVNGNHTVGHSSFDTGMSDGVSNVVSIDTKPVDSSFYKEIKDICEIGETILVDNYTRGYDGTKNYEYESQVILTRLN